MAPLKIIPHVEFNELQRLYRQEKSKKQAIRYLAVMQAYETNFYPKVSRIAQNLKVSSRTVYNWMHAWNERGLEGLKLQSSPGRPPILSEAEQDHLFEVVQTNPRTLGFDFSTWALKTITSYIQNVFNQEMSISGVHTMLTRNDIVLVKPRPMPAKADPEKKKNL